MIVRSSQVRLRSVFRSRAGMYNEGEGAAGLTG